MVWANVARRLRQSTRHKHMTGQAVKLAKALIEGHQHQAASLRVGDQIGIHSLGMNVLPFVKRSHAASRPGGSAVRSVRYRHDRKPPAKQPCVQYTLLKRSSTEDAVQGLAERGDSPG